MNQHETPQTTRPAAESAALDAAMIALDAMWKFASRMVDKHGEGGDAAMTDHDHLLFQEAAGMSHDALRAFASARNGAPAPSAPVVADPDVAADVGHSHVRPTQR